MQIGDRLRALREDRDLTQTSVARLLNTSQSYYSEYELSKRPIPVQHVITLCRFYHVSADYLLGLPRDLAWPR